ncbi:MAG: CoA-binding protein, partial [Novosphingobium sp.]
MSLEPLLRPRSIAVIGASDNPARIGGVPVDLLRRAGFAKLYPVNPKNETVQGLQAWPEIESVPEVPDLAILAISAKATLPMLRRCHARGIPAALVYASGYAETNEAEGMARQAELTAFARESGMKIAGPNAMGNANFSDAIFTTFGQSFQPGEVPGDTALLTQSGNMCATIFRMARRAGVKFGHVINTGNEAAVEFSEYLDFLASDPGTRSAICYVEQLRNGPGFLAAAARFRAAGKLLAVYRAGASEKGAEATRSHTAALAGDTAAYDAAFERAGVARSAEFGGLADLAYLHTLGGKIDGARCAILSISGAAGAILSDAIALCGGEVPTLPEQVQQGLAAQIPGHSMVSNPVDLTGNMVNSNDFLSECIRLALSPDDVDLLLLYAPGYFLTKSLDQVERAAAANSKAIVVIDTFAQADRERLAAAGIGLFEDF